MRTDSELASEVTRIRQSNKSAQVDITDLLKRRIPIGTNEALAKAEIARLGFLMVDKPGIEKPDRMVARLVLEKTFGMGDEIVLVVHFEQGAVSKLTAQLVFVSM